MITLIIAYFVICMIMGAGKMCIDEFSGAAEKERKERIQQIENEKQKKKEEASKKFEEQLKKEREAHEALIALERKAYYAQLEEKMKNFDCDKTYEDLKDKKNLSIDEMGLLYKAANMKKNKLEEKKQLLLDRAGVQLTIDDWMKQQEKDKERQDAIDAITMKDGQISFFNEVTEEQIQEQIRKNRKQKMSERHEELMRKLEESRKRSEKAIKEAEELLKTIEIKANNIINPLDEPVAKTNLHTIVSISRKTNYKGEVEYHARTDKYLLVWNPDHFNFVGRKLLKNEFVQGKNLWKRLQNQELADLFMNKCKEQWPMDFTDADDIDL